MPDMKLEAQISAVDKASPVFRQVATGAEKMGKSVEDAGKRGARSSDDLAKRAAALGAAFTAGAAILGQWSRSSQDAEAIQRQLEASIAATGASFNTYADAIEKVGARAVQLGQDDEAASQAISALTQITGSASVALDNMGLVFDLAAAKGLSLENAAELVGKVIEGNTGILQRYGIVVKEGSDATEALAQIQQQVAGQAEAHATSYARIREEISNLTDAIGGAVGGFAPFLSLLPGISSGLALAGAAAGALTGLMTTQAVAAQGAAAAELELAAATEVAAGAAVTAEVASAGLLATLGPIGLVAAAAAAAFGIYKLVKSHNEETVSASAAQKATADLAATLHDLAAAGSPLSTTAAAWAEALTQGLEGVPAKIAEIQAAMAAANPITGDQPVALDPNSELSKQIDEYNRQIGALNLASEQAADAQVALGQIFRDTGTGAKIAQDAAADLFVTFAQDNNVATLVGGLIQIGDHLGDFDITANEAAAAARELAIASTGAADGMDVLDKAVGDLTLGLAETAKGQALLSDLQLIAKDGTDANRASIQKLWEEVQAGTRAYGDFAATVTLTANVIEDQQKALDGLSAAFARATDRQASYQEGLSANMAAAEADRLRNTQRYYETEARQQEQQQERLSANIADGQERRDRESQKYFEREALRQEQYQEGLSGQITVAEEAAKKQQEINNTIIDIELPDFSKTETALERVARGSTSAAIALRAFKDIQDGIISDQDVFNQQYSEYGSQLSDIERAQKILNERTAEGQTLTKDQQEFLNGAAAAQERLTGGQEDAAIAAGELAVKYGENMSAGDQLNASLDGVTQTTGALTESINALILALGGVPPEVTTNIKADDSDAKEKTKHTTDKLDDIDGRTVSSTINADAEDAIGDGSAVISILDSIDGRNVVATATITTNNVQNNITNDVHNVATSLGLRHGGIVPHEYARGGTVTGSMTAVTVGEAGRETVMLPGGSYVRNAAATAAAGGGRGGGINLTVNVREVNGFAGVEEFVTELGRSLRSRWASMGM